VVKSGSGGTLGHGQVLGGKMGTKSLSISVYVKVPKDVSEKDVFGRIWSAAMADAASSEGVSVQVMRLNDDSE
jgi:hypothetical protein